MSLAGAIALSLVLALQGGEQPRRIYTESESAMACDLKKKPKDDCPAGQELSICDKAGSMAGVWRCDKKKPAPQPPPKTKGKK